MEFTLEDQYIMQALVERFKSKYGKVAVVAMNDSQIMHIDGELSSKKTAVALKGVIQQIEEKHADERVHLISDLINSVLEFVDDAQKDIQENDINALRFHLDNIKETVVDLRNEGDFYE